MGAHLPSVSAAAEWLSRARRPVAYTGAGLSTGPDPCLAHRALVDMEGRLGSLPVVTEAVDGLQVRAGSREVVELHGSVDAPLELDDPIPERQIRRAFDLVGSCDLLLVAGTRGLYHPAGDLPFVAREVGARVVLVAPAPTLLDADCDLRIQGPPWAILPALAARVAKLEEGIRSLRDSYDLTTGPDSPLPDLARDVVRGFFVGAETDHREPAYCRRCGYDHA